MSKGRFGLSEAQAEAFYAPLAMASSPARRVGWESDAAHLLRLRAITEALGPLDAITEVRDIGCGEGRLLDVLSARGFSGRYAGEDILASMVERAQRAHPSATFEQRDASKPGPSADAIVCSGLLNTPLGEDHLGCAKEILRELWERTSRVCVVDFATLGERPLPDHARALSVDAMWTLARQLTPLVSIRQDIICGEALLVMHRSRRPRLEALLPEQRFATERARMLLASREPEAVRATLGTESGDHGRLWQALADMMVGRVREAEGTLRALSEDPKLRPRALLHLGVVLLATRREAEATKVLTQATMSECVVADEAKVILAERAQRSGDTEAAQSWIRAIRDPWIGRELRGD